MTDLPEVITGVCVEEIRPTEMFSLGCLSHVLFSFHLTVLFLSFPRNAMFLYSAFEDGGHPLYHLLREREEKMLLSCL